MENKEIFLSTKNLTVGYQKKQIVNYLFQDLNVSVCGGEMVCFMGPNGAGKSTLLRTLAGLQKPLSGAVEVNAGNGDSRRSKAIAVVLTDRVNALNLTVREIVSFGRYPYLGWSIRLTEKDRRIVNESIEWVHLGPLLEKRLYELSDGQLQMVMIARALAQDTPVIILDEPTAHLDLNNRLEIMNLLRSLSHSLGKAILLATHELDLALQTADLIWLTGKDKDILRGLPEDLVLNGSFDDIFQFKGFDLKTGRVHHAAHKKVSARVIGEGAAYWWTKNALERNGYAVTDAQADLDITLVAVSGKTMWSVKKGGKEFLTDSLENLIKSL